MEVVAIIIYSVIICFTMQSILPVCSLSSSGNEVDWLHSIICICNGQLWLGHFNWHTANDLPAGECSVAKLRFHVIFDFCVYLVFRTGYGWVRRIEESKQRRTLCCEFVCGFLSVLVLGSATVGWLRPHSWQTSVIQNKMMQHNQLTSLPDYDRQ